MRAQSGLIIKVGGRQSASVSSLCHGAELAERCPHDVLALNTPVRIRSRKVQSRDAQRRALEVEAAHKSAPPGLALQRRPLPYRGARLDAGFE